MNPSAQLAEVLVNGETRALPPGSTVRDIVALLTERPDGCAVAVNDVVVPRSRWDHTLEAGDRVEILTAVQGG